MSSLEMRYALNLHWAPALSRNGGFLPWWEGLTPVYGAEF